MVESAGFDAEAEKKKIREKQHLAGCEGGANCGCPTNTDESERRERGERGDAVLKNISRGTARM